MPVIHIIHADATRTTLSAAEGTILLDVLQGYNTGHIPAPCGGKGTCHKCRVRLLEGAKDYPPCEADQQAFRKLQLIEGWRLACRMTLQQGSEIMVEALAHSASEKCETRLSGRQAVLSHRFKRITVRLEKPDINDQRPDCQRLLAAIAQSQCSGTPSPHEWSLDPSALRCLPSMLHKNEFCVDAILHDKCVIDVRPPQSGKLLGAAIDLGTTTVALSLFDLQSGALLHTASGANLQAQFGDDVISRISTCETDEGLDKLRDAIRLTINNLLREATDQVSVNTRDVFAFTIAGNTVMQHIFAGVSPLSIGHSPFTPVFTHAVTLQCGNTIRHLESSTAQPELLPIAPVQLLPSIGPYIGGDITAGILSQQQSMQRGNWLLIDAGTNGELVLHTRQGFTACATAAGPAFEGARISCGMRACGGAIHQIRILPDSADESVAQILIETINNEPPAGLCGSGLLDAIAFLLHTGLMDETGMLLDKDELPENMPQNLRELICEDGIQFAETVILTQGDIREFQLACAAINAGVRVLLQQAGLTADMLDGVLLAGGFGSRLSVTSAIRTGLIPADVEHRKIHAIGNASLAGAALCLLEDGAIQQAEELRKEVTCLELSGRADFQEFYIDAMEFPDMECFQQAPGL